MEYILIIGAKSDVAKAVAQIYASKGYNLYLAARNVEELQPFAQDLSIKTTCEVKLIEFDVTRFSEHDAFYKALQPSPIGVITAAGYLGNQTQAQTSFDETQKSIETNFVGLVSILNIVANDFESKRQGFIVGISSVAGDRGRQSNYIYGAAKAGYSVYLAGLRNRLYCSNVHVMDVKPGFMATKMTEQLDLPEKLTAQPQEVARSIYKGQQYKKHVLYIKPVWRIIMLIIKSIPEVIFKRLNL